MTYIPSNLALRALHLKSAIGLLAEVEKDVKDGKIDLVFAKVEDAKYYLDKFLQNFADSKRTPVDKPV